MWRKRFLDDSLKLGHRLTFNHTLTESLWLAESNITHGWYNTNCSFVFFIKGNRHKVLNRGCVATRLVRAPRGFRANFPKVARTVRGDVI